MSTAEKHVFQAEIQQLLEIVIHSLYTDREVFVRELVSNAADACERLRFQQASGGVEVHDPERTPGITVKVDKDANTIVIHDAGDGMTHGELVDNLGTIAHSGTKAFLKQLAEAKKSGDAHLIGQFGVGFYAAFMVANKVTVRTRSWRKEESGWQWVSEGANGYELSECGDLPRGTEITLSLKDDAKEFADANNLKQIIKRYSNFVQFPIEVDGERVNTVQAIWARQRSEVKEEEYNEFYHFIGHDPEDPTYRLHFNADAPLMLQSVLFVPARNLESLGMFRAEPEVHLYCRKVLIDPKAQGLLPEWLRFLRGVVDSEDLPLNVARERMQDTGLMKKLNRVLTGRFIKFLDEQSQKDPEKFSKFHKEYHRFLKEGVLNDFEHRSAIGKLLRFESTGVDAEQTTSLSEYVSRMPEAQKEVYYLPATSREAVETSPYYEACKALGYEVLILGDPVDEFVLERIEEHDGKKLVSAEKADLKVPGDDSKPGLSEDESKGLAEWLKERLSSAIEEVKVSERLIGSPAMIMDRDPHMTATMRRTLRALRQSSEVVPPDGGGLNLEINPKHEVIVRLNGLRQKDADLAGQIAEQLLDNARMAAGLLEDPRTMLQRINTLLQKLLEK